MVQKEQTRPSTSKPKPEPEPEKPKPDTEEDQKKKEVRFIKRLIIAVFHVTAWRLYVFWSNASDVVQPVIQDIIW